MNLFLCNVIISSSKPPSLGVFHVSFRWLYTCHTTSPWVFQPKFQVPNLGISHHQSLDVAPPAPALNMESSASLCLGIIGNLRADPPPPNANPWEPKASASGKKRCLKEENYDKVYTISSSKKQKLYIALSKHLGHSPWTLGLKDPNWLNICPMGCFNCPTVSKTLSRFSLSYDVAPVRADTTFSIPLTLGMQASHLSTNSGAKS